MLHLYLYCRVKNTHLFVPKVLSVYSLNVPYSLHLCEQGDKVSGWKYGTAGNKRPSVLYLANFVEEAKSWRKSKLFLIQILPFLEMTWLLFPLKPDGGLQQFEYRIPIDIQKCTRVFDNLFGNFQQLSILYSCSSKGLSFCVATHYSDIMRSATSGYTLFQTVLFSIPQLLFKYLTHSAVIF